MTEPTLPATAICTLLQVQFHSGNSRHSCCGHRHQLTASCVLCCCDRHPSLGQQGGALQLPQGFMEPGYAPLPVSAVHSKDN